MVINDYLPHGSTSEQRIDDNRGAFIGGANSNPWERMFDITPLREEGGRPSRRGLASFSTASVCKDNERAPPGVDAPGLPGPASVSTHTHAGPHGFKSTGVVIIIHPDQEQNPSL